mgnify:CR=1 FL=1
MWNSNFNIIHIFGIFFRYLFLIKVSIIILFLLFEQNGNICFLSVFERYVLRKPHNVSANLVFDPLLLTLYLSANNFKSFNVIFIIIQYNNILFMP